MILVRFACGHTIDVPPTVNERPECPCGAPGARQRVSVTATPPTFRGACGGPLAQTNMTIEPWRAPLVAGKE
jgi:hypothetical protein